MFTTQVSVCECLVWVLIMNVEVESVLVPWTLLVHWMAFIWAKQTRGNRSTCLPPRHQYNIQSKNIIQCPTITFYLGGEYVCTPITGTLLHFMVFGYLCMIYQSMNQLEMLVSAPKIHEQHSIQAVTAFQPKRRQTSPQMLIYRPSVSDPNWTNKKEKLLYYTLIKL